MNGRRALAVIACAGLSLLPACDPCEGARIRALGSDFEPHLEACAEVAVTEEDRRRGLAGRPELADGEGLWLEFPVVGEVCITGEGMLFALDVVMVDGAGRVAEIGALEEDDPSSICVPEIRSVLEVPAGAAASVRRGDMVESRLP